MHCMQQGITAANLPIADPGQAECFVDVSPLWKKQQNIIS